VALRAVLWLSVFPTAYFLHAGYSESLFIALVVSSFYYARTGRWLLASILGGLAPLTRITGWVLFPALVSEYLAQRGFDKKKEMLYVALIPVGVLCYLMVNYIHFGNAFQFLASVKQYWSSEPAPFWRGLIGTWTAIPLRPPAERLMVGYAELLFAGIGCVA